MEFFFVTLMIIIGITDSRADQFDVVGTVDPLYTVSGEDVILPCSLKPNISAVNMRVEWFRLDLKGSVVYRYEDHQDKNTNQLQSYKGRTQVFKDELQKGNTSLKLSRVQVSDEGLYKCLVESKSWSGDITVDLRIEVVGSPPLITLYGFDGSGGLHLQCESKGWYPEPELVWLDSEGVTLTSETTETKRDKDGFRVKHMITVYNSNSKYHCRVRMRHHMLETEIVTSGKMFNSWKASVTLITVGSVFIVITGILTIVCVYRALKNVVQDSQNKLESLQKESKDLKSLVQDSQNKLKSFQKEKEDLKSLVQDSQNKLESFQKEKEDFRRLVQDLQNKLESFQNENKARKIAFSAGLLASGEGHTGPCDDKTTLIYKKVFSNIGNAYDSNTGIFTAPVKGGYYFKVHAFSYGGITMAVSLYKNDVSQCSAFSWKPVSNGNSSNGVILTLEPGDQVYTKLWDKTWVFDNENSHTSFSGFLIFPL